ncbi:MAG: VanZ family protein [Bacilli bacterium]|nr:VanZ family protein [Bacilli bacterium]
MKKKSTKYIFLTIYLILILIFYFFTLRSGDESSKDSSITANIVLAILKFFAFHKIEFDYEIIHHITRKMVGHYGYNLIIGLFGFLTVYSFRGIGNYTLIISIFLGLVIAISGELLQFIPANRAPSVVDMLINFFGEATGVLLPYVIILYRSNKNKNII